MVDEVAGDDDGCGSSKACLRCVGCFAGVEGYIGRGGSGVVVLLLTWFAPAAVIAPPVDGVEETTCGGSTPW